MFLQKIMLLIIVYFGIKSITRRPMAALLKRATHIFSPSPIFLLIIDSGPSNVSKILNSYSTTAEFKLILAIALTHNFIMNEINMEPFQDNPEMQRVLYLCCSLFGLCLAFVWSLFGLNTVFSILPGNFTSEFSLAFI